MATQHRRLGGVRRRRHEHGVEQRVAQQQVLRLGVLGPPDRPVQLGRAPLLVGRVELPKRVADRLAPLELPRARAVDPAEADRGQLTGPGLGGQFEQRHVVVV